MTRPEREDDRGKLFPTLLVGDYVEREAKKRAGHSLIAAEGEAHECDHALSFQAAAGAPESVLRDRIGHERRTADSLLRLNEVFEFLLPLIMQHTRHVLDGDLLKPILPQVADFHHIAIPTIRLFTGAAPPSGTISR